MVGSQQGLAGSREAAGVLLRRIPPPAPPFPVPLCARLTHKAVVVVRLAVWLDARQPVAKAALDIGHVHVHLQERKGLWCWVGGVEKNVGQGMNQLGCALPAPAAAASSRVCTQHCG